MARLLNRWRGGGSRVPTSPATRGARVPTLAVLVWPALILILALALGARLYNVNWDEGTHIHPDERHLTIVTIDVRLPGGIGEFFDTETSPLNPYNLPATGSFVYGTLPVFLTKVAAVVFERDDYDNLVLVGRHLSGILEAGTVLLVFLVGRRLYGPAAGLIAGALYAAAPLAIQHAHFYVVDPFLTFFMAAALYFSIRIVQQGRAWDYGLAGLALGLAMACKITAVIFLPVLAAAVVVRLWPLLPAALRQGGDRATLLPPALGLVAALLVAFFAFRAAQPYAFETPRLSNLGVALNQRWVDDQRAQNRLLGGEVGFPPSVQWIDRTSYLYPLREMVVWGMGPAFGLAGWLAVLYAGYRLASRREVQHLLPLVFVLAYFGFMGQQFSLYMRYFLPLYPVLAVLAGFGLVRLYAAVRARAPAWRASGFNPLAAGAVGAVLLVAVLAGLAYLSIYTRDFTRAEASRWIHANLPHGAFIAVEEWDEALPLRVPGVEHRAYRVYGMRLYEADSPQKSEGLINDLDQADYVIVSSNRLMNSLPRNRVNYPLSSRYHEMLLDGDLGFELVRSFTSYPGLLGIEFPDHHVQESWSSYDHPRVLIFQKAPHYSRELLEEALGHGPWAAAVLPPAEAGNGGLLLSPRDLRAQREGGTWTNVFSDGGLPGSFPTLVWLLALQAAALAVTPPALLLFRRLPDRGYLLTKALAVLLLAYPVWLLVSLKLVTFSQETVLLWLIVLLVGGVVAWQWRRPELNAFFKSNWRLILFSEALFLLAFFAFRELRLENPDLWHPFRGGEKPMDLAYFTAVTRSTTLPPYDPWFAGGYINYYYLGQFFSATLTRLTSIPPEIAYNLAVPTFAALTVGGAFSVAYNLAAATKGFLRRRASLGRIPSWSLYAAGLLGAFLVVVAGNLDGVGQLVQRLSAVSAWRADSGLPVFDSVINSAGGLWQVVFHGATLQQFDFWRSSRMMPPSISITEFPYFSFLFADLHAHMMAIPFQVLAIGVCLALVLERGRRRDLRLDIALLALLGLVVGSLRWINSWDYPPFLLLALAAVLISERHLEGGVAAALRRAVLKGMLLTGLSFLFYQPFLSAYRTPVAGVISSPETTPIHQYLAHFGLFAVVIGAWLLFMAIRALKSSELAHLTSETLRLREAFRRQLRAALLVVVVIFLLAGVYFLAIGGQQLVAVLLPVLAVVALLAWREVSKPRPDGGLRLFVLALAGLGLGLSIGVDLVTLQGDIVRMNTVFKFYLHVWVLFALVAAYAAWHFFFVLWPGALATLHRPMAHLRARAGVVALALLLVGVSLYPLFATGPRLDDRFANLPRTLDGMAYMRQAVYNDPHGPIDLSLDYEGILWLRENVEGTPAIVEGRTNLYRWGGRFSIYTGLPAVIGWDWHQTQQRGDLSFMIGQRVRQVDRFYGQPDVDEAISFLRQYDVRYVVLGQVERLYYPARGLAKFDNGLDGTLEVAFENEGLTIFRVLPAVVTPAAQGR